MTTQLKYSSFENIAHNWKEKKRCSDIDEKYILLLLVIKIKEKKQIGFEYIVRKENKIPLQTKPTIQVSTNID